MSADRARVVVGGADPELDGELSAALTAFNRAASRSPEQTEITVRVRDDDGALVAGLSGWTWGTGAGIALVWVREDSRRGGWGGLLLEAAERTAAERGCTRVVVSSFVFQAPAFYARHGYRELVRIPDFPFPGAADVYLVKDLTPTP